MLKRIPPIISPDLMKTLMEMGHGDEICLADGNFPSTTYGKRVIRLDGNSIPEILVPILNFMPLEKTADGSVMLMDNEDESKRPPIWNKYKQIFEESEERSSFCGFKMLARSAFYERARNCFAVISTGESSLYANIIIRKGVI